MVHCRRHPSSMRAHLSDRMHQSSKAAHPTARSSYGPQRRQQIRDADTTCSTHYKEQDDKLDISIDVPGVRISDLNVTVDDQVLTICGTRQSSGLKFSRQFALDVSIVDADNVCANLVDGVLTITVPKVAKLAPMKVEISDGPAASQQKAESSKANASIEDETKAEVLAVVLDASEDSAGSVPKEVEEDDEDDEMVMVETVDDDDVMPEDETVKA